MKHEILKEVDDGKTTYKAILTLTNPEKYISYIIDKINQLTCQFMYKNIKRPEVIYLDGVTYKKIEIANRATNNTLMQIEFNRLCGLEIKVLPLTEETIIPAYKDDCDNVTLSLRGVENE